MPEDFAIDTNRQTSYDQLGDILTVTGRSAVEQALFIAIYETVDMTPPPFQDAAIEEQRSAIETAVRTHPWTQNPVSVNVSNRNPATDSITYRVQTNRLSFTTETT